jgi:L-threonylcarbamoyladenylate synthase
MLNSIKGRIDKPYIVLVSCTEKAIKFSADFKKPFVQLLVQHYWPGPLTMIVKAHANMPTYLRSKDGTIAIRVPSHKKLQKVLEHFDGLFSTSANKAGEPIPHKVTLIDPSIKKYLALLVEEEKNQQIPSTIIDVTGEAPRLVRQGVLRLEK